MEIVHSEDEIDFRKLFRVLIRNKITVGGFSLLFFLLSLLFGFTRKNIWEGQLEIVLDTSANNNSSLLNNSQIAGLIGQNFTNNNVGSLATEVGILESPSVLMLIYQYAKNYDQKNISNLTFSEWRDKKLKIEIKKDTSILKISYLDSDKSKIINVLDKISEAYQRYSGRSKRRNLELSKNYLTKEINKYKLKSSLSIKNAENFAIQEDLYTLNNIPVVLSSKISRNSKDSGIDEVLLPNTGIEDIRVRSANAIREIDAAISKIKALDNNYEKLQFIGSIIPNLAQEGFSKDLNEIEKNLIEMKSKYKPEDPALKNLIKKREAFIKLFKNRALGYLEAQKISEQSKMESAMRPKGVILKYKELIREATRDEKTLINLENNLRALNLEESRLEDPWELITNPTLKEDPVFPNKKLFLVVGTFLGFILGYFMAILKERKTGFIYERDVISKLLNTKIFEKIKLNSTGEDFFQGNSMIKELIMMNSDKIIKLFIVGDFDKNLLNQFSQNKFFINSKIDICDDIKELKNIDYLILATSLSLIRYSDVKDLKYWLDLTKTDLLGAFLFE